MVPKKKTPRQGTWKLGCVEQADRGSENQSAGPPSSPKGLASADACFPSHTRWGSPDGKEEGAVNEHSQGSAPTRTIQQGQPRAGGYLPTCGAPKLSGGGGYAGRWGPAHPTGQELNFHVASFKLLLAWQVKSLSVKGHFYALDTERSLLVPQPLCSQTGSPSSLHSNNAAVRVILLTCKYAPVTWLFGILQWSY